MNYDELKQVAIELREQQVPWSQIEQVFAERTGEHWNKDRIRSAVRNNPNYKGKATFVDKKSAPEDIDVLEYYDLLKQVDRKASDMDTKQTRMTVEIDDDRPIGIAFFGDWHIGGHGVDYEQFDADRKLIAETEGIYCVGMGDYKDNQSPFVHASGVHEAITTQGMQDMLVMQFVSELKDKTLALVRGCHDDWDKKLGDKDFVARLCELADCVNLWHGGGINIQLGEQLYKIRARHKYKNESGLNTTNAQRNMLNDFGPCDVIAIAHKHFPDMQILDRMGQRVVYLRSGSYKHYDEHGQKLAGYTGKIGVPVMVLYPREKRVVPFQELRDGIAYLKAVRG